MRRLLVMLIFCGVAFGSLAQAGDLDSDEGVAPMFLDWNIAWKQTPLYWKSRLGWVVPAKSKPWSASDKPFLLAAQQVEKALSAQNGDVDAVYQQCEQAVQSQPSDTTRYGWAYIAWKSYRRSRESRVLRKPLVEMQKHYVPSYQYTKMLLCLQLHGDFNNVKLMEPVGQRLLKRNPADLTVQSQMADLLDGLPTQSARKQAIALTSDLIKHDPKSFDYRIQLAFIYNQWWLWESLVKDNKAALRYADLALVAYQEATKVAAPGSRWVTKYGPIATENITDWKRKNGF